MIIKFILLTLLMTSVNARLFFQVSVENKKGIDLGLVLTSELHSLEEVVIGKPLLLQMKNGVAIEMKAFWAETPKDYGPSEKILIEGKIFDKRNKVLKEFAKEPLIAQLGKETVIYHEKEDQRIELKITPTIN